jgi:hypothetical protein
MRTGTWQGTGIAGLLALSLASCGHDRPARAQAPPPAPAPPRSAQPAPAPAPVRQDDLAQAQSRLQTAHQDVERARQQLADAQRREEQARAEVQQLEIKARQDLERATQLALQAEQAQGLQSATGRVAQASPSRVLLQLQDGRMMSFQVDDRTRVLVGAEQRSVADIQQGADARVAYDPRGADPRAVTIRIAEVGRGMGAPPASAPPSGSEPAQGR